jgi:hypothetical protein
MRKGYTTLVTLFFKKKSIVIGFDNNKTPVIIKKTGTENRTKLSKK